MAKIGRNDPCPCGSGKKYKNCCMKKETNVVDFQSKAVKQDLERLHYDFMEFTEKYRDMAKDLIFSTFEEENFSFDAEGAEGPFTEMLTLWAFFNVPMEEGQAPFQYFVDQRQTDYRPRAIEKVRQWNTVPWMYEVVDHLDEDYFVVRVFGEDRQITVKFAVSELPPVGCGLVGILVPYGTHEFQFLISFHQFDLDHLVSVFREWQRKAPNDLENVFRERFALILQHLFSHSESPYEIIAEYEWETEKQLGVAELFCEMNEETVLSEVRAPGIDLWHRFCEENHPRIGKVEVSAATLEYLVNLMEGNETTQKETAQKYGVSPGSVSNRMQEMDYLFFEFIDEVVGDDSMGSLAPNPNMSLERELKNLERAMEGRHFESKEEMDQFIEERLNQSRYSRPRSKKEQAEDLVYEAWELPPGEERVRMAKQALAFYPNTPDAYVVLAEEADSFQAMKDAFYVGMMVGEKELGPDFFAENRGHFWMMVETRPYMRAKQGYAECLWELGERGEAIGQFQEMLDLNTGDNLGIRYRLLPALLQEERYQEADEILKSYDEPTANMAYNRAYLDYVTNGWTKHTEDLLQKAIESNPHVPEYLLREKRLPKVEPSYVGMGDKNEAIDYAQNHVHLWLMKKELLERLKETVEKK